jgi:hypothetical protein
MPHDVCAYDQIMPNVCPRTGPGVSAIQLNTRFRPPLPGRTDSDAVQLRIAGRDADG